MEVDSELNICHEHMGVTQPLRRRQRAARGSDQRVIAALSRRPELNGAAKTQRRFEADSLRRASKRESTSFGVRAITSVRQVK